MSFTFKHPKYYKELRTRNKSDQAISDSVDPASGVDSVRPGPGLQVTQQVVYQVMLTSQSQATSHKLQATSFKLQATSYKQQASSVR